MRWSAARTARRSSQQPKCEPGCLFLSGFSSRISWSGVWRRVRTGRRREGLRRAYQNPGPSQLGNSDGGEGPLAVEAVDLAGEEAAPADAGQQALDHGQPAHAIAPHGDAPDFLAALLLPGTGEDDRLVAGLGQALGQVAGIGLDSAAAFRRVHATDNRDAHGEVPGGLPEEADTIHARAATINSGERGGGRAALFLSLSGCRMAHGIQDCRRPAGRRSRPAPRVRQGAALPEGLTERGGAVPAVAGASPLRGVVAHLRRAPVARRLLDGYLPDRSPTLESPPPCKCSVKRAEEPISPDDLDLARSIAKCSACGNVFNCAEQLESVASRGSA